jgi:hypothetical protein
MSEDSPSQLPRKRESKPGKKARQVVSLALAARKLWRPAWRIIGVTWFSLQAINALVM